MHTAEQPAPSVSAALRQAPDRRCGISTAAERGGGRSSGRGGSPTPLQLQAIQKSTIVICYPYVGSNGAPARLAANASAIHCDPVSAPLEEAGREPWGGAHVATGLRPVRQFRPVHHRRGD